MAEVYGNTGIQLVGGNDVSVVNISLQLGNLRDVYSDECIAWVEEH